MPWLRWNQVSLKTRVMLFTLGIFLVGIWTLAYYSSRILRNDMQRMLGEQQFSTVSGIANEIDGRLSDRMQALETIAKEVTPEVLGNGPALQALLEHRPLLQLLFNGGVFVTRTDGTAIADAPVSAGRIGTNYLDRDSVSIPLKQGKTVIGRPAMGKKLGAPIFSVTAPLFDSKGRVMGVIVGTINLGKPNFLDQIARSRYGKSGGYLLIAPQHQLIVTATDKTRAMQPAPSAGLNAMHDRYMQGYEGYGTAVSSRGVLELSAAKRIPATGWFIVAALPAQEAFAPIESMLQRLLLSTLLFTALAGALMWWLISRMLQQQFAPMVAASKALASQSTTDQPVQNLPVMRHDEIGELVGGFNRLLESYRAREDALRESEARFRTLVDAVPDAIALHRNGKLLFVNPAAVELFGGKTAQDLLDKPLLELVHPDFHKIVIERVQQGTEQGIPAPRLDERYVKLDGTVFDAEVQGTPMVVEGKPAVLVTLRDITERKAHESQLEHIAHFDALTNLPNRVLLADRLHQAMAQAQRRGQQLAVTYLDLDGFKTINDHHGHEAGDQVLIALAQRMNEVLRQGDTLARLGGDEFVAVLIDLEDPSASAPLLNRLLVAASQPVQVGELSLQVSASLGVTFYPQSQEIDADQLLRQADQAMYLAKVAGKGRYQIFDATQDRHLRGEHESLERMRHALENHEFVLHYQPKINMRTGQCVGVEALIRWQHPEKGLLAPALFLPVMEDHPLAVAVGEWVIDTALTQIEHWAAAGLDMEVSVNIGARQLQQSDFVERLQAILAAHPKVHPGSLTLEVLETSALEDIASVSQLIEVCAQMGVMFALDDFGTGYSSLTYLKRLRVTLLKIDQSFVRDMLDDPDDLAILEGIIGLAAAFRRQVIAEGVETIAHGSMLLELGCELAQGYGIARPMPAAQLPQWWQAWRPDAAWSAPQWPADLA